MINFYEYYNDSSILNRWLEAEHKLDDYEELYSRWFNISGGLL